MNSVEVVKAYWAAMRTNDFSKASMWLSESYVCYWPQSQETIKGRENFIEINKHYPTDSEWLFEVIEVVGSGDRIVSDVCITDGRVKARAVTFHTIENGLIASQKEFWPDEYEPPIWRAQWIDRD